MRIKRKIKLRIAISCLVVVALYLIVDGVLKLRESNKDDKSVVYNLTSEDSNIISKKYLARIKVRLVIKSSVREPVSFVDYDKKYQIVIHKIYFATAISLPSAFKITEQNVDEPIGHVYTVIPYNSFKFQWKAGLVKKASKLILTMSGDSIQNVVKSDSIMSYYFKCNNFSIRYSEDSAIDLFVVADNKLFRMGNFPPMSVLFLTQKDAVYLLAITPNDSKIPLPPDLLYKIVTGN